MITRQIHFKNFELARPLIAGVKTKYRVHSHMTMSSEKGLVLTFEIDESNLEEHLELIESFGLETY